MDDRTPGQKEADEKLEEAIRAVALEYDYIDPDEIITTWIAVGSAVNFRDGRADDSFFLITPEQHLSPFQSIGLLRYGQITIEAASASSQMYEAYRDYDPEEEDTDDGESN